MLLEEFHRMQNAMGRRFVGRNACPILKGGRDASID
jgi:hypothetical protein